MPGHLCEIRASSSGPSVFRRRGRVRGSAGRVMEDLCPICFDEPPVDLVECPCPGRHRFCRRCLGAKCLLRCPMCRDDSEAVARFLFRVAVPEEPELAWLVDGMHEVRRAGFPPWRGAPLACSQCLREFLRSLARPR